MTHVHVVYTHPGVRGFTREILDAFLAGLGEAGHSYTVSDLYVMGFRSELTAQEYERESGYRPDLPVPDDVAAEHAKLDAADVWVFIYPVWWADCPARLKGWFDRVWTVGFAYKGAGARVADKVLVLCTAGYSVAELEASGCYQAMRTVMLTDRIGQRARSSEFVVFGGSVAGNDGEGDGEGGGAARWMVERKGHLAQAAALGRSV